MSNNIPTLRDYQLEAIANIDDYLMQHQRGNPCVVIPTGGGKTPVIAEFTRRVVEAGGRVLILAHVKELLEQAAEKLCAFAPDLRRAFGIYSASLKRRDTHTAVVIAGIQSVYKRAKELGHFDVVLIDEAHMIPPDGEGRYRTYLKDAMEINPNLRLVGFTATPYRMKSGMICADDNLLNHVCHETGVLELIDAGHLCRVSTKGAAQEVDLSNVSIVMNEFKADELENAMNTETNVQNAIYEMLQRTGDRKSVLIFASGIGHANAIAAKLRAAGEPVQTVFGDTTMLERAQCVADFKSGKLKFLVNVGVFTLGFDAPNVDCVVLLRPTMSPGLYYQMVGRGFRVHASKTNCMVLDYAGNAMRHGPVDAIEVKKRPGTGKPVVKKCPECLAIVMGGVKVCPDCGHIFPITPKETKHSDQASKAPVLSDQPVTAGVIDVTYAVHTKRGADENVPKTMRVSYQLSLYQWVSEWVCIEHKGFARDKAVKWWREMAIDHGDAGVTPVPLTAAEAVSLAERGDILHKPVEISYRMKNGFPEIIHRLLTVEENSSASNVENIEDEKLPF